MISRFSEIALMAGCETDNQAQLLQVTFLYGCLERVVGCIHAFFIYHEHGHFHIM